MQIAFQTIDFEQIQTLLKTRNINGQKLLKSCVLNGFINRLPLITNQLNLNYLRFQIPKIKIQLVGKWVWISLDCV